MGMSLRDTLETFGYLIKALDDLKITYIALVRYVTATDPTIDGKLHATQHDIVKSYRPFIEHSKFVLNGGLTSVEANDLLEDGIIDAAAFGFPSDLQHRFEQNKPLDAVVDFKNIYHVDGVVLSVGYTDYPRRSISS